MAERAGVSETEYQDYDAGTTIFSLEQNRQAFEPGDTMASLPYAAERIGEFLVEVKLAEKPPQLDNLLQPKFVQAVP
jgi:NitT/TauT family transport system substrate-binding protein